MKPVPNKPIIIALDDTDPDQLQRLLTQLTPERCRFKIGKALFTRFGPALIETLTTRGFEVFLDLKYHDIPEQVKKACRAAIDLNIWMLTVHASGGQRMLEEAKEGLSYSSHPPLLVAVTVLTSLNQKDLAQLGIPLPLEEYVLKLGKLALNSGVDGLVCSPHEVSMLKHEIEDPCILVTPGVRPAGSDAKDQQRTLTPGEAIQRGADFLVIGRPITQAADPLSALHKIEVDIFPQRV